MATFRGSSNREYFIGEAPPFVEWTVVRGDTAAFRIYVTDDARDPLIISDWNLQMQIKRPNVSADLGKITDNATLILNITPLADANDGPGEFTVSLTSQESNLLQTGDIFDVEISLPQDQIVWTVAQGRMKVLEDVTA